MRKRNRKQLRPLGIVLIAVVALVGCGGGSSAAASTRFGPATVKCTDGRCRASFQHCSADLQQYLRAPTPPAVQSNDQLAALLAKLFATKYSGRFDGWSCSEPLPNGSG